MITRRDDLIGSMTAHVRRIATDRSIPNVLFVTGEAGIGKSTLLDAVSAECGRMASPPVVAIAQCSTPLAGQDIGEVEALQPWAQVMAQLATGEPETKHDTKKLVADVALAWLECVPVVGDVLSAVAQTTVAVKKHMEGTTGATTKPAYAASQEQMFQQYINFLARLAEQTPLVLMIDDFHWADTSSTNLLFSAARQLQGKPVVFVIAYRADDAASSRGGEGHPILHIRNELERYSLASELDVPRMSATDLDKLLRERYANYQNNDRFEEWIARVSGGNALFITQFLATLEEDGHIDRASGTIHDGYEQIEVPRSAQAVVQERIRRLNEETRELLRYASVEGDTFTAAVLAKVSEVPQLKLLQRLRLVEQTHHLIKSLGKVRLYATESSAYQFAHILLHRALYDGLSEEERELLHQAVFDMLKAEWEGARQSGLAVRSMAARLAVHAEALGRYRFAAEVLLAGASACWKDYAGDEALRLLDGASACLDRLVEPIEVEAMILRGGVLVLRAEIRTTYGDYEAALSALGPAIELLERAGARTELYDAMNVRARVLLHLGRYDDAGEVAEKLITGSRETGYVRGQAQALCQLGVVRSFHGEYRAAEELYRQGADLSLEIGEVELSTTLLNNIGTVVQRRGEYARALEYYEQSRKVAEAGGRQSALARVLGNIGSIHEMLGNTEEAADYYGRSHAMYETIGDRAGQVFAMQNLGWATAELGDPDAALECLGRACALANDIGEPRL